MFTLWTVNLQIKSSQIPERNLFDHKKSTLCTVAQLFQPVSLGAKNYPKFAKQKQKQKNCVRIAWPGKEKKQNVFKEDAWNAIKVTQCVTCILCFIYR